jgi:hypothetical protein
LWPFGLWQFRLIAHPPGTTMAWSFAFNFAAEHTVKFAAPSQLIRKVLKLPGSIWEHNKFF